MRGGRWVASDMGQHRGAKDCERGLDVSMAFAAWLGYCCKSELRALDRIRTVRTRSTEEAISLDDSGAEIDQILGAGIHLREGPGSTSGASSRRISVQTTHDGRRKPQGMIVETERSAAQRKGVWDARARDEG